MCFQGWAFGFGQPSGWLLFPREDWFFCSHHSLVACSFCVELRPCDLPPITWACLLLSLFRSCLDSRVGKTLWVELLTFLEDTSYSKRPELLALTLFLPLLQWSLSLGCGGRLADVSLGTGLHNSVFWLVVILCNGFHMFQREVFLTRMENHTYLWVKRQIFWM